MPRPVPVLDERWSLARAFAVTPATVGVSGALGLAAIGGVVALAWRRGRDRRFRGSQVDQIMGNPTGEQQAPRRERESEGERGEKEVAPRDG